MANYGSRELRDPNEAMATFAGADFSAKGPDVSALQRAMVQALEGEDAVACANQDLAQLDIVMFGDASEAGADPGTQATVHAEVTRMYSFDDNGVDLGWVIGGTAVAYTHRGEQRIDVVRLQADSAEVNNVLFWGTSAAGNADSHASEWEAMQEGRQYVSWDTGKQRLIRERRTALVMHIAAVVLGQGPDAVDLSATVRYARPANILARIGGTSALPLPRRDEFLEDNEE